MVQGWSIFNTMFTKKIKNLQNCNIVKKAVAYSSNNYYYFMKYLHYSENSTKYLNSVYSYRIHFEKFNL